MKRSTLSLVAIVLVSSLTLLTACKKTEPPAPAVDSMQTPPPAVDNTQTPPAKANGATGTVTQEARESTMQSARQELDQIKTKIDALKVKAKDATADMKDKLNQQAQSFDQDFQGLETQYNKLKDASASTWQDVKTSFDNAMTKLKASVDSSDH